MKTLEHHNLEEENYTLKFNKLSRTITKNHKRKINKLSYIKINIYKAVIAHLYIKEDISSYEKQC